MLEAEGFTVIERPSIAVKMMPYRRDAIDDNKKLDDFDIIAFTSKRGVEGAAPVAEQIRKANRQIAVVGQKTAEAVETIIGRPPDIIAEPQTGEVLARTICREKDAPCSLLHFRGAKANPAFKRILEKKGIHVTQAIVYKTEAPEIKPIDAEGQVVIVFASPSAVKNFIKVNNTSIRNAAACIAVGPVTAEALKKHKAPNIVVADAPDNNEILKKIRGIAGR